MDSLLKIQQHLAHVATLSCETLTSAKQAINDKLQRKLRCGGVVNNQIKKGLLPSLRMKKCLQSVNISQSYKQARYDTIRYEMPFNVRSKADISHLNLPHGTDN